MVALDGPLVLLYWPFAIISCARGALARAQVIHERYQAVETGALLSPRYYPPSPAQPLLKRQNACPANHHSCLELGDIGRATCCRNDEYCIVNPSDRTKSACCQIGSTCGSKCDASQIECLATTTITSAGTTTTSEVPACCGRRCTRTSEFGCPSALGNGCCPYGQTCQAGNKCISTIQESSTQSPIVPLVPDGCTAGQRTCDASLGGGCCALTQSCVRIETGVACAEVTITPTASGITAVPVESELSAGAKAGISVGVIVVAGLVIGGATYMCLRKRRRRRSEAASSSANPRPRIPVGAVIGAGGSGGGRAMTDLNSDSVSRPGGGGGGGIMQDYFGPDPQVGPYSDVHYDQLSPGATPSIGGERGGVPLMPHGPGDIAAPVEIDSEVPQPSPQPASTALASPDSDESNIVPNNGYFGASSDGSRFQPPPSHMAVAGTFELYGSDPGPDPPPGGNLTTPYVPSPSVAGGSQVPPTGEAMPGPNTGFDGAEYRR